MEHWWRPHVGGYSFETGQAKASTGGFSNQVAPNPKTPIPPPVPDTPQMQQQRASYDYHYQSSAVRSNWDGGGYEQRHEGRGTHVRFGNDRSGTQYAQQNSTDMVPHYPDPWHSSGVSAGPPLPHLAERLGPTSPSDRIRSQMEDPHYREPPPVIDLRQSGGLLYQTPDPGGRPFVEWPGAGRDAGPQGWGRGGP